MINFGGFARIDDQVSPEYALDSEPLVSADGGSLCVAVMPACPYKPKFEANVEVAGHIAARWYKAHLCHHLQGLSGVGNDKPHPAIAQAHVGYLYCLCDTTQDHRLVRPIELISLTRFEVQRDEGIL